MALGRALLIIGHALAHLPIEGLKKFEVQCSMQLPERALSLVFSASEREPSLLEVCLEAVTLIWSRFQDLKLDELRLKRMLLSTARQINCNEGAETTKVQLLRTLTAFLA